MSSESGTPRTDEEEFLIDSGYCDELPREGDLGPAVVMASFARQLERELAEAHAAIEEMGKNILLERDIRRQELAEARERASNGILVSAAQLSKWREKLSHHMFGGEYGDYNNGGVISTMDEIDAILAALNAQRGETTEAKP